jgi:hypothetical protein
VHIDILTFFLILSFGFPCIAFEIGVVCITTGMFCVGGGLVWGCEMVDLCATIPQYIRFAIPVAHRSIAELANRINQ